MELKEKIKKILDVVVDVAASHPKQDIGEFLEYEQAIDQILEAIQADRVRWLESILPEKIDPMAFYPDRMSEESEGFNKAIEEILKKAKVDK